MYALKNLYAEVYSKAQHIKLFLKADGKQLSAAENTGWMEAEFSGTLQEKYVLG